MPPTINNEAGEPIEPQEHDIVQSSSGYLYRYVCPKLRNDGIFHARALIDRTIALNVRTSLWIAREPPFIPENDDKAPFAVRRERLLKNLLRAARLSSGSSSAITDLRGRVEEEGDIQSIWFWSSVAESHDSPRLVSYATEKRYYDNDKRRKHSTWAKFLKGPAKKLGGLSLSQEEILYVSELIGDTFPDTYDYHFEFIRGEGIYEAYRDITHSCMSRKPYVRWFEQAPDKVSLVAILQGNAAVGRALLWTADDGSRIVDRIYPSDGGPHIAALHRYAEEQGWDYKTRQNMDDLNLKSGRSDYRITMPSSDWGYPYLDTFKYSESDPRFGDSIVLQADEATALHFVDTEGGYRDNRKSCYACNVRGSDFTEADGRYYCPACADENVVNAMWHEGSRDYEMTTLRSRSFACETCDVTRHMDQRRILVSEEGGEEITHCIACMPSRVYRCLDCRRYFAGGGSFDYCFICRQGGQQTANQGAELSSTKEGRRRFPGSYPRGITFEYDAYCPQASCTRCPAIRARREWEIDNDVSIYATLRNSQTCPCGRLHATTRNQHITGPYPNEFERAVLERERSLSSVTIPDFTYTLVTSAPTTEVIDVSP